jgi:hypothetical protein
VSIASNIDLIDLAKFSQLMLAAGAKVTARGKKYLMELGRNFEFHRGNYNTRYVKQTSDALERLYQLFDVPPVPRRAMHDGKSPITVKATRWQKQHAELWELLVPSSGPAETIQGEAIRIAGKVGREILDNGCINWDADFRTMGKALFGYLQTGAALEAAELAELKTITGRLSRGPDDDCARMAELAVAWVLRNPKPARLGPVKYKR